MKKVIIPIVFGLLTVSYPGHVASAPSEQKVLRKAAVRPEPTLTPVASKLMLNFFRPYEWSCFNAPSDQSNPKLVDGNASLVTNNTATYYCKITVTPNSPASTFNASTYKFTWIKKGEYLDIKVPKEASSIITVDFYESCNLCIASTFARPVWHGQLTLQAGQPYVTVNMDYMNKFPC